MMSSKPRFRSLLGPKILKTNDRILTDGAKRILVMSQAFCTLWNLWPEYNGLSKLVCYVFQTVTCAFLILSSLVYLFTNAKDVAELIQIILYVDCVLQALAKVSILFHKAEQLKTLLAIVRWEFWPSNIFGKKIDRQSRQNSKLLFILFLIEYAASQSFIVIFLLLPLTRNNRELPHETWFPLDWSVSPTYQLLYFLHISLATFDISVLGFDSLYCGICLNCEAQFRLLCHAIGYVGSGRENDVLQKLAELSGDENYGSNMKRKEENVLIICIKHHQKLLRVCDKLNEIFGNGHLTQLATSIMGICAACYGLTAETSSNHIATILLNVLMYLAHTAQLFTFCAVSDELSHRSASLSTAAFQTSWYEKKYTRLRRDLIMVIMRSQRPVSMNAFGLFPLDYISFLGVIRFSFSLYTFLSKMAK